METLVARYGRRLRMAIPFDWTTFAKEIGEDFDKAGAGIRQRAYEKRAEARELRMAREKQGIALEGLEERLKIEEPFKELSDERIMERQKELAKYGKQLQMQYNEWETTRNRGLDIFSGSEGYQKAIEDARKEGGLSEVAIMKMEGAIMEARAGGLPDISYFEGLQPHARLQIMDLLKQNKQRAEQFQMQKQRLENEALQLQSILQNREELRKQREQLGDVRGMAAMNTLNANVDKAEKAHHEGFRELMNDLTEADILKEGKFRVDTPGRLKKDPRLPLLDAETGEVNEETLKKLLTKYPNYAPRFKRLFQLQAKVMREHTIRDAFTSEEPTGETGEEAVTWTGSDGKEYTVGQTYTIGGQEVICTGENQFEPVK